MAHWPWETDDVILTAVQALTKKVDALASLVKTQFIKEMKAMGAITDLIGELDGELDAAKARIDEDVANYEARIAQLQQQVADGTATPEDIANLALLIEKVKGLDPTNPNVFPG